MVGTRNAVLSHGQARPRSAGLYRYRLCDTPQETHHEGRKFVDLGFARVIQFLRKPSIESLRHAEGRPVAAGGICAVF